MGFYSKVECKWIISAKKILRYNSPPGVITIFYLTHIMCAAKLIPACCVYCPFPTAPYLSLHITTCTCAFHLAYIPNFIVSYFSLYVLTSPITLISRLFFSPPHSSIKFILLFIIHFIPHMVISSVIHYPISFRLPWYQMCHPLNRT